MACPSIQSQLAILEGLFILGAVEWLTGFATARDGSLAISRLGIYRAPPQLCSPLLMLPWRLLQASETKQRFAVRSVIVLMTSKCLLPVGQQALVRRSLVMLSLVEK
mmetsp:Transcript_63892/g.161058  ORF Transcript_63892/g.161058 Transcript_63892/m.161058 type:complete len:107 (-) Transcript_63892:106-426(-)